jgi:hypothetical protein
MDAVVIASYKEDCSIVIDLVAGCVVTLLIKYYVRLWIILLFLSFIPILNQSQNVFLVTLKHTKFGASK